MDFFPKNMEKLPLFPNIQAKKQKQNFGDFRTIKNSFEKTQKKGGDGVVFFYILQHKILTDFWDTPYRV